MSVRPRENVGTMQMLARAMRLLPGLLRHAALALALLLLIAWLLGRVAGDRWLWSQYLSWIPTLLICPAALVLLGLWRLLLPRKGRRRRQASRDRARIRQGRSGLITPARTATLLTLFSIVHLLMIDLNAPALLRVSREGDFRVLFWNAANRPLEFPPTLVRAQGADLAIIVNPRWRMGREMLFTMVADAEPGPKQGHVVWRQGFAIASRHPILEHGSTSLGLRGVRDGMDPGHEGDAAYDPGSAAFVVLDTRKDLGHAIVVWALDLPSDPRLSRMANVRAARSAIARWKAPDGSPGFPDPDIIVGDLNIPRGSASLRTLAPSMHSAASASAGLRGTWPRGASLWQIDHVLHSRDWRATRFVTIDPGVGSHRMIVGDLDALD